MLLSSHRERRENCFSSRPPTLLSHNLMLKIFCNKVIAFTSHLPGDPSLFSLSISLWVVCAKHYISCSSSWRCCLSLQLKFSGNFKSMQTFQSGECCALWLRANSNVCQYHTSQLTQNCSKTRHWLSRKPITSTSVTKSCLIASLVVFEWAANFHH